MSFDIQMMNITVYVNKKNEKNHFKVESGKSTKKAILLTFKER